MDINEMQQRLKWVPSGILSVAERYLKRIPRVKAMIENEYNEMLGGIEGSLKPYRKDFTTYSKLPQVGIARSEIIEEVSAIKKREEFTLARRICLRRGI